MKRVPFLAVPVLLLLAVPTQPKAQSSKSTPQQEKQLKAWLAASKKTPTSGKQPIKVLGVHCAEGEGDIVGLEVCQEIMDKMRRMAPYLTVRNCPSMLDKNQELEVRCLPKDDEDTMLTVLRDWKLSQNGETPVAMGLLSVATGKMLFVVPGTWDVCIDIGPNGSFQHTTEGSVTCAVNKVVSFIYGYDNPPKKKKN